MNLSQLAEQHLTKARAAQQGADLPVGTVTAALEYAQLHYAEVIGVTGNNTATIDLSGNIVGMSPGERCTIDGVTRWVPLEQLRSLRTTPFIEAPAAAKAPSAPGATRSRRATRKPAAQKPAA